MMVSLAGLLLLRFLGSGFLSLISYLLFSSRLPGGGITFFAAAKKVIKESSFYRQARWLDCVA
jgi:hypothetical protein